MQGFRKYLEEYRVDTIGIDGHSPRICETSRSVCDNSTPNHNRAWASVVARLRDPASSDKFPSLWQIPAASPRDEKEISLWFCFWISVHYWSGCIWWDHSSCCRAAGAAPLDAARKQHSSFKQQCGSSVTNNRKQKRVERSVVMNKVEKRRWSHDFLLSFGIMQNHFLIEELPRLPRINLSFFSVHWNTMYQRALQPTALGAFLDWILGLESTWHLMNVSIWPLALQRPTRHSESHDLCPHEACRELWSLLSVGDMVSQLSLDKSLYI